MKNVEQWKETKFIYKESIIKASRSAKYVGAPSRIMAEMIARNFTINIPLFCKGDLLDLGCGMVPLYSSYNKYVNSITCLDWESSLHNNAHVDVLCDITKVLPLENKKYETVIFSDVLEHVPNPSFVISEINRVMKVDGYLFISVPFYYLKHEPPFDFYRYTDFGLKYLLDNNGFDIIEIKPLGGSVEIIADIFGRHLQFIPLIGLPIVSLLHDFILFFNKTFIGKKILLKTSNSFPYGYFIIAKKR